MPIESPKENLLVPKQRRTTRPVLVAIDIAKNRHEVLVEAAPRSRRRMKVANERSDFDRLADYLDSIGRPVMIGFEPTADYHRPLAYFLLGRGFDVRLVSSLAVARTREALQNSWDKNDPLDAQVILHLLKTTRTNAFHDPVVAGNNDLQELSNTHAQLSKRRTRLQNSIVNHFLAIYFPEIEPFMKSSRAHWFGKLVGVFPTPRSVLERSEEQFLVEGGQLVKGKQSKTALLRAYYEAAQGSVGVPIALDSTAVAMFRLMVQEHLELSQKRMELEKTAHAMLKDERDYQTLRSIPGIGPIVALTVLAEAGNMRRFGHERQYLKFCGLDLATNQSGKHRSATKLSKRGNARLRSAYWIAATVAVRLRENSFRDKFSRYIQRDPTDRDLRRKAYTAVTAKMARISYHLVTKNREYRPFYEVGVPSRRTRSERAVEATSTS